MLIRAVFILIFSFLFLGKSQISWNISEFSEVSEILQLEKNSEDSVSENETIFNIATFSLFHGNLILESTSLLPTFLHYPTLLKIKNLRGPPKFT